MLVLIESLSKSIDAIEIKLMEQQQTDLPILRTWNIRKLGLR